MIVSYQVIFWIQYGVIILGGALLILLSWKTPIWTFARLCLTSGGILILDANSTRIGRLKVGKLSKSGITKDGIPIETKGDPVFESKSMRPLYISFSTKSTACSPESAAVATELNKSGWSFWKIKKNENVPPVIAKVETFRAYGIMDLLSFLPFNSNPNYVESKIQRSVSASLKLRNKLTGAVIFAIVAIMLAAAIAFAIIMKSKGATCPACICQLKDVAQTAVQTALTG